ncbi:MAG: ATP-binding protein [Deltaproteobacteria bacterium]|nr:ATP-binding protein [Deltaproteobacteria bacterium]
MSGESLQRELRAVFAGEAADSLARVESMLARQRLAPADRSLVETLFREFHTMKVGAAAAGFSVAAHALDEAESLLDAVRGAAADLPAPGGLDALRRVVARVRGEVGSGAAQSTPGTLAVLWPLLARATAEAAASERKFVALETLGGECAVGGVTLTALRGVLLHLVRNAVAHGIEPPAARAAVGKPRVGRVVVDAEGDDGVLLLSVADDGRGLDRTAIAHVAGGDEPAEAAVLRSGVSTRGAADALAGRGVGLDAVAHAISALGGDLSIESRDGAGCTVRLIVPA